MTPKFNTRAYNQITKLENGVIKKTSASERLLDEINYYKTVSNIKEIDVLYPRLVDYIFEADSYNLFLEFYPYSTLSDFFLSTEKKDWDKIFTDLKRAMTVMYGITPREAQDTKAFARAMYIDKTFIEYENFVKIYNDKDLFVQNKIVINQVQYKNFIELWPAVKIKIANLLENYSPSVIHGDLCFSNILYHEQVGPRFIDMRGSFGQKGVYGDSIYDYAKLFHSVNGGYEYIINDKFIVNKVKPAEYDINLLTTDNKQLAYNSFTTTFKHLNLPLIKLVEGLIYIGMCARHYDSQTRQLIMYLTGIKSLNESIQEI